MGILSHEHHFKNGTNNFDDLPDTCLPELVTKRPTCDLRSHDADLWGLWSYTARQPFGYWSSIVMQLTDIISRSCGFSKCIRTRKQSLPLSVLWKFISRDHLGIIFWPNDSSKFSELHDGARSVILLSTPFVGKVFIPIDHVRLEKYY